MIKWNKTALKYVNKTSTSNRDRRHYKHKSKETEIETQNEKIPSSMYIVIKTKIEIIEIRCCSFNIIKDKSTSKEHSRSASLRK